MRQTTKKLNGAARDRFLARLGAEPSLAAIVTSLRVRSADYARVGTKIVAPPPGHAPTAPSPALTPPPMATPRPSPIEADRAAPPDTEPTRAEPPFDPYGIGLVPVYQRAGRDGLLGQLQSITRIDHLRQLARAQNIVLPPELRTGDATAANLHVAIVDAVARRIADRRGGD